MSEDVSKKEQPQSRPLEVGDVLVWASDSDCEFTTIDRVTATQAVAGYRKFKRELRPHIFDRDELVTDPINPDWRRGYWSLALPRHYAAADAMERKKAALHVINAVTWRNLDHLTLEAVVAALRATGPEGLVPAKQDRSEAQPVGTGPDQREGGAQITEQRTEGQH